MIFIIFIIFHNLFVISNMAYSSSKLKQNHHKNLFKKSCFSDCMLADRYLFSKFSYQIEDLNLHTGIENISESQTIVLSNQVRQKGEQSNETDSKPKCMKKQTHDFCLLPIWSQVKTINKKAFYFEVYPKSGCSVSEYLTELSKIKYDHIHFILYLLLKLLAQVHASSMNLKYLDWKALYLTNEQGKNDMKIQILEAAVKKKPVTNHTIMVKDRQKVKEKKNIKVEFNMRHEYLTQSSKKQDLQMISNAVFGLFYSILLHPSIQNIHAFEEIQNFMNFVMLSVEEHTSKSQKNFYQEVSFKHRKIIDEKLKMETIVQQAMAIKDRIKHYKQRQIKSLLEQFPKRMIEEEQEQQVGSQINSNQKVSTIVESHTLQSRENRLIILGSREDEQLK